MGRPERTVDLADGNDAGRSCPFCRFPLKEAAAVVRCPVCRAVHHAECWQENGDSCAVVGCPGASPAARPEAAPVPAVANTSTPLEPPPSRNGRGTPFWIACSALFLALAAVASVLAVVLGGRTSSSRAERSQPPAASTPAATVTVRVTTPQAPAKTHHAGGPQTPAPRSSGPSATGVPAVYAGRFTAVDRLERCNATAAYVYCSAGPSGKAVKLVGGRAVDLGVRGSSDLGGAAMPEGTSFRTPNGRYTCASSSRGITCRDTVHGATFVIGDYQVSVDNPSRSSSAAPSAVPRPYSGYFTSVDRLERCFANDEYAVCSAGPSGKAVKLVAGGGAAYQGVLGSSDRGGPAMAEGDSFMTPAGTIRCGSSTRGITCTDLASGSAFVIGDYQVHVINHGHDAVH
jgi:hypothetical protein